MDFHSMDAKMKIMTDRCLPGAKEKVIIYGIGTWDKGMQCRRDYRNLQRNEKMKFWMPAKRFIEHKVFMG